MKPIDQDKFGKPNGNCFTACLASILEVSLDELRDVEELYRKGAAAWEECRCQETWAHCLDQIDRHLIERFRCRMAHLSFLSDAPLGYAIASGEGPRGVGHCVVVLDGKIAHDPHPDRTGLTGPPEIYTKLVEVVLP